MTIPASRVDSPNSAPHANPAAKMPTRFGVGLMLLFLSLFSVGFFLLTALGVPAETILYLSLLFAAVAAAQVLWPSRPRSASSVAGALLTPAYAVGYAIWEHIQEIANPKVVDLLLHAAIGFIPLTAGFGAFFGYLAGTLLAGLFLRIGLRTEDPPPEIVLAELSTSTVMDPAASD